MVLHDGPFGKVDIILLNNVLHSLFDVVRFLHFFFVDLLVTLIQMLLLLIALLLLKLSVD